MAEFTWSWWQGAKIAGSPCPRCECMKVRKHTVALEFTRANTEYRCDRCRHTWMTWEPE